MIMNEPNAGFCDPTVLTRWTRGLLYTSLAVSLASVYIGSVFVMSGVVLEAVSGHEGDLEGELRSVELEGTERLFAAGMVVGVVAHSVLGFGVGVLFGDARPGGGRCGAR